MSEKLRHGRVKVYCPRCEEVYIPHIKFNLDGAFFGPSLVHMFIAEYKTQVLLPPKIMMYEPRMFGFLIAGKRGSKYFIPAKGATQLTSDRQAGLRDAIVIGKIDKQRIPNNRVNSR